MFVYLPVVCSCVSPGKQHGTKQDKIETGLWPGCLLYTDDQQHVRTKITTMIIIRVSMLYKHRAFFVLFIKQYPTERRIKRALFYCEWFRLFSLVCCSPIY